MTDLARLVDDKLDRLLAGQEAESKRLDAIEETQRILVRALVAIDGTLRTHTEVLNAIADAANAEGPDGGKLREAFEKISGELAAQTIVMADILQDTRALPERTADAVEARMDAAMPPPPLEGDEG